MPVFTYSKIVNQRILQQELVTTGFLVTGITQHWGETHELVVNLDAAETKDPTAVVNAHIYTEDLQPNLVHAKDTIVAKFVQARNTLTVANTQIGTAETQIAAAGNVAQLRTAVGALVDAVQNVMVGLNQLGDCLKWSGRVIYHLAGAIDLDDAEYASGELNLDR